jgi:hypothetical protein
MSDHFFCVDVRASQDILRCGRSRLHLQRLAPTNRHGARVVSGPYMFLSIINYGLRPSRGNRLHYAVVDLVIGLDTYIHANHLRFISKGVAETSQLLDIL